MQADQLTVGEVGCAWVKVVAVVVNPCRWQRPRPPKGPASWVLSSLSCGPGDGSTEMSGLSRVRDGGRFASGAVGLGCAHQDRVGEIYRANLGGGALCPSLGLSFQISKMGAK